MLARRYATRQVEGLLPLWKVYCIGCLLLTAGFAALISIFGKPVLHILYAGKFDDLAPLLGSLALLPVVMGLGNTMNDAIKALEKPKLAFYAYACSGITTLLAGVPLVMRFGLRGAVYGMLLSAAIYSAALAVGFLSSIRGKAARKIMPASQTNFLSNPSAEHDFSSALPAYNTESIRQLAPIALFVYNRPEHTRRTVESLRANDLASQSDIFVFADGAKNQSTASTVGAVREFIRTIDGFKSVTIIEHEGNFGLAASVIAGVTQLCEEFGRLIVMEDDLLTSSDFLIFMNCALERYADEPRIFSVSGYNFSVSPPELYPYDAFCSFRSSSWGWGTWKDRWEKADWKMSDYPSFSRDKEKKRSFNRGGEDLADMLSLQMAGRLDSWAIRWAYAHWKHDAFALLPVSTRVFNIGLDGSGVHCHGAAFRQALLAPSTNSAYRLPHFVEMKPYFAGEIQRVHRQSLLRKIVTYLRRTVRAAGFFGSKLIPMAEARQSAAGKEAGVNR
jgi:hypothetical protein